MIYFIWKKFSNIFSVKKVLSDKKIKTIIFNRKFDQKKTLELIKDNIDFIISLNSVIFQKDIILSPKQTCINRHSSILPENQGLIPIFYYMRDGKEYMGSTYHEMTNKIDKGRILSQKKIPLSKKDSLFKNYEKIFKFDIIKLMKQ